MTNAELIKALRECKDHEFCTDCKMLPNGILSDFCNIKEIAADALEAAEKRIAIAEEERDLERFAAKSYLDKIDELEAQLPKEGEWIDENRRTNDEADC